MTKEEYRKHGSVELTNLVSGKLEQEGRKPYQIPVGGSNALGTWGYLNCFEEILNQSLNIEPFTDIITVFYKLVIISEYNDIGLWKWRYCSWIMFRCLFE